MFPQLYTKLGHTKLTQFVGTLLKKSSNLIHIALTIVTSHMRCGPENNVPTTIKVPAM